jgi:flagellar biosynthesis GTPase FlhF
LTNGQNVPDDIAVATADALTDKLMLGSITAFGRAREGAISTFKLPHVDAA